MNLQKAAYRNSVFERRQTTALINHLTSKCKHAQIIQQDVSKHVMHNHTAKKSSSSTSNRGIYRILDPQTSSFASCAPAMLRTAEPLGWTMLFSIALGFSSLSEGMASHQQDCCLLCSAWSFLGRNNNCIEINCICLFDYLFALLHIIGNQVSQIYLTITNSRLLLKPSRKICGYTKK